MMKKSVFWMTFLSLWLYPAIANCAPPPKPVTVPMTLSSPAFAPHGEIPQKFTCQGANVNPELDIRNIPAGAKTLVLIVEDPDSPIGIWTHWVVFDITPVKKIEEDSIPGIQGMSDFQQNNYSGPCPPSGSHRYFFKLYALNTQLDLGPEVTRIDVLKAMRGHIVAKAELVGTYRKK